MRDSKKFAISSSVSYEYLKQDENGRHHHEVVAYISCSGACCHPSIWQQVLLHHASLYISKGRMTKMGFLLGVVRNHGYE